MTMDWINTIMGFVSENPLEIAVAADLIAGALPDKFTRWPGLLLTIANKAYLYGKKGDAGKAG